MDVHTGLPLISIQQSQVISLFHTADEKNIIKDVRDIMAVDLSLEKKYACVKTGSRSSARSTASSADWTTSRKCTS